MKLLRSTFKYSYLSSGLLGILLSFCFYPYSYFWLTFIVFAVLISLIYQPENNTKVSAFIGFWFGIGHFASSLYWITSPLTLDLATYGAVIPLVIVITSVVLALFYAAFAALIHFLGKTYKEFWPRFLFIPSTWVVLEYIRSFLFTGLPWNLLGYTATPYLTFSWIAFYISVYGIGWVIIAMSYVLSTLQQGVLTPYLPSSSMFLGKGLKPLVAKLATLTTIMLLWHLSGKSYLKKYPPSFENEVKIHVMQHSMPAIAPTKWTPEDSQRKLDTIINLSQFTDNGEKNIYFWPEDALGFEIPQEMIEANSKTIFETMIPGGSNNIVLSGGAITKGSEAYNTMLTLDGDGKILQYYKKMHLVPFGEYIPLRAITNNFSIFRTLYDFTAGDKPSILKLHDINFFPLICYEIIFPTEISTSLNKLKGQQIDAIINTTNDSWFGSTSGPHQHYNMTRMQAITFGLPLVRVASNGISAVIDGVGREIQTMPLNYRGKIELFLPKRLINNFNFNPLKLYIPILSSIILVSVFLIMRKRTCYHRYGAR